MPADIKTAEPSRPGLNKALVVFAFVLGLLHILWGAFLLCALIYQEWDSSNGQAFLHQLGFRGEGLAFLSVLLWGFLGFVIGSLSMTAGFDLRRRRRWATVLLLAVVIGTAVFWIEFLGLARS